MEGRTIYTMSWSKLTLQSKQVMVREDSTSEAQVNPFTKCLVEFAYLLIGEGIKWKISMKF